MNNPFPRAAAGSYKTILIEGLAAIGETSLSAEFEKGAMKLAIASTIYGNVKLFPEAKPMLLKALEAISQNDAVSYYHWGIMNGQFVAASSDVNFIYDPMNKEAVAYNKAMIEQDQNEVIQPFFKY